jgi:hypothetical protein
MEMVKILVSIILGILGPWMMWRGKKLMDVKLIVWGGILIILSYFIFSGGNDSDVSKTAINALISPTPSEQQP